MRYFKDDKDGFYVVCEGVEILPNWTEITLEEYVVFNPQQSPQQLTTTPE